MHQFKEFKGSTIHNIINKIGLLILRVCYLFLTANAVAANVGKVKVNDINMYYELHGKSNAVPIILIAGFTCDHTFWTGMLNQLTKNHTVLIFDNRGIGQTDSPDSAYSIEMMADDTMALSKRLGLKNPIIIGQSMGSAIAQNIGKRYANQVKDIILINTFDKLTKAPEMAFELTGELQRMNLPVSYRVQSIVPWVFSSEFLSQANQLANLVKLAQDNHYPQSLIGYTRQLDALKAFNSRPWLHEIKAPTLIISGEEDIIAPLAGSKEVQKGIGNNTQVVIVPGEHASPIEQPDKVIGAIFKFIR